MALLTAMGYATWELLRRKDDKQEAEINEIKANHEKHINSMHEQIEALFKKHDIDAARLEDFKLEIAKGHYTAPQLDIRFDRLDAAIKSAIHELGAKLDKLNDTLISKRNA